MMPRKDLADYEGRTLLMHAVKSERLDLVELLLCAGAPPNCRDRWDGATALHLAIQLPDTDEQSIMAIVKALIDAGANPDSELTDFDRTTPLGLARTIGYVDVARLLLRSGARIVRSKGPTFGSREQKHAAGSVRMKIMDQIIRSALGQNQAFRRTAFPY